MKYSDTYVQHWADHVRVTPGAAEVQRQDETAKAIEIANEWAMSCKDKLEWKEECRFRGLPWKSTLIRVYESDGVSSFGDSLRWIEAKHPIASPDDDEGFLAIIMDPDA
jgi:hypothetical protein